MLYSRPESVSTVQIALNELRCLIMANLDKAYARGCMVCAQAELDRLYATYTFAREVSGAVAPFDDVRLSCKPSTDQVSLNLQGVGAQTSAVTTEFPTLEGSAVDGHGLTSANDAVEHGDAERDLAALPEPVMGMELGPDDVLIAEGRLWRARRQQEP